MSERTRARFAWAIAIASLCIVVVFGLYSLAINRAENDPMTTLAVFLSAAAFGLVGATITARTGNAVGWALLSVVATLAASAGGQAYATYALTRSGAPWPLAPFAAWIGTLAFFLTLAVIPGILLLYPTGKPRWRWVWRVYLVAVASLLAGFAIKPDPVSLIIGEIPNPFAIPSLDPVLGIVTGIAGLAIVACAGAGVASLIVRYRRSHGDERQQIRWLAYVGVAGAIALALMIITTSIFGDPPPPGLPSILTGLAFGALLLIVVLGIPAACGIAILKYHLYDLDVVIKKALVALVLALILAAIGLAAFALAGQIALWQGTPKGLSVTIGIGLGLLIVPTLRVARRIADRIVYGKRATPYEVLATFSGRVGETYATDDVLPRMAQILMAGSGAASARVLVRVGAEQREAATAGEPLGPEHLEPIVFQGEEVGTLAVTFPANDPLDAQRRELIAHLASQAGPVVRNVRLIEELRASRQRLVAAQDEERRKIERNLHDGVQQQLVAMNVQLGLLARVVGTDAEKAGEMATALQGRATEALDDLRDLARGIYPPLLADKGLAVALESQARKAAVPTTVTADGIGRYPQDIEAAVYFCALEALNNVAKYARATSAAIELSHTDGHLQFAVRDNGHGFDTSATAYGTGLQGMADRLDAIGGTLHVTSTHGDGTTVLGRLPDLSGRERA